MKSIKKDLSPLRNIRFSISSVGSQKNAVTERDDGVKKDSYSL